MTITSNHAKARSVLAELTERWDALLSTLARLSVRPSHRADLVRLEEGIVYLGRTEIGYVAPDDAFPGYWLGAGVSDTMPTAYRSAEYAALAVATLHVRRAER